jgi:polysaccharide export outer membrane protein
MYLMFERKIGWLAMVLLCLLLGACASTSGMTAGTLRPVSNSPSLLAPTDTTAASGAYEGVSEYRIGPQDLLAISVFGVAELSQEVRVNSNGQISLPLIGNLQAGGQTIQELERAIAGKLSAGYLQSPQVSVFVKEYTSQRVTVEGAINKPGIYPLTGRTTLLQVIATGGGLSELADPRGIVIFREIKGQQMVAAFDLEAIRHGSAEDPQVYGDDKVVVDQSGPKSRFRQIIQALPLIGVFTLMGL